VVVVAFRENGRLVDLARAAVVVPSGVYELEEDVFGALCHLVAREVKGK